MKTITWLLAIIIASTLYLTPRDRQIAQEPALPDLSALSLIGNYSSGSQLSLSPLRPELTDTKFIVWGYAERYLPPVVHKKKSNLNKIQTEYYWRLADSVALDGLVPPGSNLAVKLNTQSMKLEVISPYSHTVAAKAAIAKAPAWIRPELGHVLGQLSVAVQDKISLVINEAQHPYIDEVCYAIAYSTPQFLQSKYCYPNLFIENAKLMYENDKFINYAEIIDYGIAGVDDNFYSTVKYRRSDTLGCITEFEVPMDVYYLYLVHPKITDEIQAYVDYKTYEPDANQAHVFNIKAPPQGRFWRDFIFNFTEPRTDNSEVLFPVLKDSIMFCEVLWDDANAKRSAIKEITSWIKNVMVFDSKQERPHQPNRIYKLHMGRCGEHEDITAAAARSCLIPCRGIEAYSSDHVWNEYWDMEWQQWEPVNNSYRNKLGYSKGWGKKFGTVFSHESRGVFTSVTSDYCENTSDITIYAMDANDKPIDGATLKLYVSGTLDETSIFLDTYGIADCDGKCVFKVESGRTYYARLESALGNNPAEQNKVTQLPDKPEPGQCYSFKIKATGKLPAISINDLEPSGDSTLSEYRLVADYECDRHFVNWQNIFDDMTGGYTLLEKDNGTINFFIADSLSYDSCKARTTFGAYLAQTASQDGKADFCFGEPGPWHIVFNNGTKLKNIVNVKATVKLYVYDDVAVEGIEHQKDGSIISVTPNPTDGQAVIEYCIQETSNTIIEIANSSGEIIKSINSWQQEGTQRLSWDTSDDTGNPVPSGIYYCRIRNSFSQYFAKITVIR